MPKPPPGSRRDMDKDKIKFGKFLAIGMAVALVWGLLLLFAGIYVRFKFGSVLGGIIGNFKANVDSNAATSPSGQNIAPTGDITNDINMGSWTNLLGSMILSSAILTVLFACLGMFSGLNHNKLVLIVTVVILVVTAFLLLGLISIMADTDASFHTEAKNELIDLLQTEYTVESTTSSFVFAMNSLMFWFQCCGVVGVRDFHNLSFHETSSGQGSHIILLKVAPACCVREMFNAKDMPESTYNRVKDCAIRGYEEMEYLNNKGCYNAMFKSVQGMASAILALILIWNVLVLVLAILTIMEIKPEPEIQAVVSKEKEVVVVPDRRVPYKEKEIPVPVVKKFIPYAKISSFMHPDITRIKSTEIW